MRTIRTLRVCGALSFAILVWSGCSNSPGPDPVDYPGTWIGYVGFMATNHPSAGSLVIDQDEVCTYSAEITDHSTAWGDFTLRIEGAPELRTGDRLLGDVVITRIRAGIDTVSVDGQISGQFNLPMRKVSGIWTVWPDQAFGASGEWAAEKQQ